MTDTSAPIAYLTSRYPAMSHTFIQREIDGLRALGREVITVSVRGRSDADFAGDEETRAARETFYILQEAKNPLRLLAAHGRALRTPGRYLRALGLALRSGPPGVKGGLYQLIYFAEAGILADHLSRSGARHLHVHFADRPANVGLLTHALTGIPFSYTLHGPAELYEPRSWRLDLKTARAAFVACISHFARSQAMYFSDPAHWARLRIIHCGVDPALYDRPKTLAPGQTHFVFVGRLTAIKGLRVLIDAFAAAQARDASLRLTIVGEGEDRAHLERQAAPLGEAVRFTGALTQPQVADMLATADAFVLPSFAEGVPVVLMEALASRTPVISTLVAGIPELVEDGVNGHLVPPGDASALTQRMLDLAADPAARAAMGEAGRAKVCAEFNIHTEAARIAALFDGAGGDAPRPDPVKD